MKPGRELDALVAEKVFNLPRSLWHEGKDFRDENGAGLVEVGVMPDPYSTDIAAAWLVVEQMKADWWIDVEATGNLYEVSFESRQLISERQFHRHADTTAPHAICLAALKAMGVFPLFP